MLPRTYIRKINRPPVAPRFSPSSSYLIPHDLKKRLRPSAHLKRPIICVAYAQSLDGCLSAQQGQSSAISGPRSQLFTHALRSIHDGILIGGTTLRCDDPQLNVRHLPGPSPQPIVLTGTLQIPFEARLLNQANRPCWFATTPSSAPEAKQYLRDAGHEVLEIPSQPHQGSSVNLSSLLNQLWQRGITSLMIEGGSQVIQAFAQQRLIDVMAITIAPKLLAGAQPVRIKAPMPFHLAASCSSSYGQDTLMWGTPVFSSPPTHSS